MGFEAAFSIDARRCGRYGWERTQITPLDGPTMFALKSRGFYLPLRRSRLGSVVYATVRPLVRRLSDRKRSRSSRASDAEA
jgi:hypothetical protein